MMRSQPQHSRNRKQSISEGYPSDLGDPSGSRARVSLVRQLLQASRLRVKFKQMSRKYKLSDQQRLHFVTFTVIEWIDVFTRNEYREIFVDSVKFCQANKGLEVGAWCIMPSHVHLIVGTSGEFRLEDTIRDLKSYTSRHIRKAIENPNQVHES